MTDSEKTIPDLTLHEAAALLGVHYMTAYRYVRLGLLPARKVGGVWQVSGDDVADFRGNNDGRGVAQLEMVDDHPGRRQAPWTERMESRLIAGDARGAWGVIEAALSAGSTLDDIYTQVMTPALVSIGAQWARGELDISVEHRASGIAMRMIGRLGPRFARRGRSRGLVVLGAPAGERHALPLAMVADLVHQRGWEVSDLGADVPVDSFVHAVMEAGDELVAVGMSVSLDAHLPVAAETLAAIRAAAPDARVFIGGRAIVDEAHAQALGAAYFAQSMDQVVSILERRR
jgi:excisionase family DNA binding protein